ncbi:MAG: glycosyltransferase [Saprospiraceae bacterium]|nr:glycosyltransferase [Saprospiraceae bacterium]
MTGKKIIFAVTNDLTYDRRMFRICAALSSTGAEVTLVGRKLKNSIVFTPSHFRGLRFRCWFNKGPLFYIEYNKRLFFTLLRHDFDIVCACDLDTALAVRLAAWVKMKKSVYDAHEYFSEVPELTQRPAIKKIWEWIAKRTIPGFDACYTVGEELASLMGRRYKVHFDVIRNIAPTAASGQALLQRDADEKILLYQGALNVGRGLEACIEAMVHLPDWKFWLAGEGDITEQLKELAKSSGVTDNVVFLGWVKPDHIPQLMKQARLSINLREVGSLNDYYSLPNKFFDAMHAGLPSINMNYPEYATICNRYPCALLLDEVKVDKIVEAIEYLDQHPMVLQSMAEACGAAAKEYTWENEAKKLIEIYSHFKKYETVSGV